MNGKTLSELFTKFNAKLAIDVAGRYGVSIVDCINDARDYMGKYFGNKAIYTQEQYDAIPDKDRENLIILSCIRVSPNHENALKSLHTWDMSLCPNARYMFAGCEIKSNIGNWDMRSCANMDYMFHEASGDIHFHDWNTENVKTMRGMFKSFDGKLCDTLGNLNMSNVQNIAEMFSKCKAKIPESIGKWDIKNVKTMEELFAFYEKVPPKTINHWDISNVSNMENVFYPFQILDGYDWTKKN